MGKFLIIVGLVIALIGVLIHLSPGNGWPRLPGDIYIRKENYIFYFPLGWSVLISVVVGLVYWLFGKWG